MIDQDEQGTSMDCGEAIQRLVALQDGELSPSEAVQVQEHLAACGACRMREYRLAAATPRDTLRIPPAVLARLSDRVSADVVLALADRPAANRPHPGWVARAAGWLRRDLEIPAAAVLGYVVLLAMSLGWAASSWLSHPSIDVTGDGSHAASEIPAEQWRPAAYNPEGEEGVH